MLGGLEDQLAEQRVGDESLAPLSSTEILQSFAVVWVVDVVGCCGVDQIVFVVAAGGSCSRTQPLPQKAWAQ